MNFISFVGGIYVSTQYIKISIYQEPIYPIHFQSSLVFAYSEEKKQLQ